MAKKKPSPSAKAATGTTQQGSAPHSLNAFSAQPFADVVSDLREHLSRSRKLFLFGAGSSKCAGLPLMPELTAMALGHLKKAKKDTTHAILAKIEGRFKGAASPNIEDYMSELVDLACIADRREKRGSTAATVTVDDMEYRAEELHEALAEIKDAIAEVILKIDSDIATHRAFCNAIHRTATSGKPGRRPAVDYFTLNYDTLIEDALSLERLSICDGFHGGATGWWNADLYTTEQADARVFKVHGSIDWCLGEGDVLPRRLRHGLGIAGDHERVLIWPAATKYRETQRDPYAQIIDHMRTSLRPSASEETLLVVCGYAFGDSHINLEIERAIRESGERVTVIIFTSDDEPQECLRSWLDDSAIGSQVQAFCNRGFFHGVDETLSDNDLPWWRFEVLTQILTGEV